MDGARAVGRRPAVMIGLALAVGWYSKLVQVVESSAVGVVGVAALVWLVERSRLLDRS